MEAAAIALIQSLSGTPWALVALAGIVVVCLMIYRLGLALKDNTVLTGAVATKISGGTHQDVVAAVAQLGATMATRESQLEIDRKVDGIDSRLSRLEGDTELRFKDLESKIELKACKNSPQCANRLQL